MPKYRHVDAKVILLRTDSLAGRFWVLVNSRRAGAYSLDVWIFYMYEVRFLPLTFGL
jgi:hypothetical protein